MCSAGSGSMKCGFWRLERGSRALGVEFAAAIASYASGSWKADGKTGRPLGDGRVPSLSWC